MRTFALAAAFAATFATSAHAATTGPRSGPGFLGRIVCLICPGPLCPPTIPFGA